MLSLDAPAPSLSLSQTTSAIRFRDRNPALYTQTLQTADSEKNIQSSLLLGSWNKW
jgi:hypothetical protein